MSKIKWGLIGCGDISRKRVVPGIKDSKNSKLIAVNRSDFSRAMSFAKEFGAKKWMKKWQDLIADDEIDAVYIATPVYLHAEQSIAAAEAGKHILCEKSMAMNTLEADRMIDACKANNVKLGIAYYRNLYPGVHRIKEIISDREIGNIVHIQSNNFENFNRKPGEARYWLLEKEKSGGGPMMDMGCHRIEVFVNIAGQVKQVTSFNDNIVFKREVEDSSIAHFRFESGTTGILSSSHAAKEPKDTLDIYGSEGSIHVPILNEGTMTIITNNGTRVEKHPNPANVHQAIIEDFIQAITEDIEPAVTGKMGREITRILDKIYSR
ncbi:MAG: Gfo/Idh/MocA family oxidoreductase [Spirochaetia bacterium]|jgi:predicted dehydrogenase|nr:Gfo/Idh/MocA family oxidoreductase [Spirochaetia bacterium]